MQGQDCGQLFTLGTIRRLTSCVWATWAFACNKSAVLIRPCEKVTDSIPHALAPTERASQVDLSTNEILPSTASPDGDDIGDNQNCDASQVAPVGKNALDSAESKPQGGVCPPLSRMAATSANVGVAAADVAVDIAGCKEEGDSKVSVEVEQTALLTGTAREVQEEVVWLREQLRQRTLQLQEVVAVGVGIEWVM